MNETKSYKLSIFGDHYTVVSDESEVHLLESAHMVDMIMKDIAQKSRNPDAKKIAVLAALKVASNLLNIERQQEYDKRGYAELMKLIEKEIS